MENNEVIKSFDVLTCFVQDVQSPNSKCVRFGSVDSNSRSGSAPMSLKLVNDCKDIFKKLFY